MSPHRLSIRKRDNTFQRMEVIRSNREKRTRYGEFLVEGVLPITRLIQARWPIRAFAFSSDHPLSDWAKKVLQSTACEEHLDLSDELLKELSEKEDGSELLAIACMAKDDISRIIPTPTGLVVVMDRPISPGNLGSTIRSAEAFGASGVFVSGHAADIYDPQCIRSSRGSLFALPVVRCSSHREVLNWISTASASGHLFQVIGTDADVPQSLYEVNFQKPTILLMGNETSGLSRAYRELSTCTVKIPMLGSSDSLNVSCAASICLYEVTRQRLQS